MRRRINLWPSIGETGLGNSGRGSLLEKNPGGGGRGTQACRVRGQLLDFRQRGSFVATGGPAPGRTELTGCAPKPVSLTPACSSALRTAGSVRASSSCFQ